jgi:hypothetical protein
MVASRERLPTGVNQYPSGDILADSCILECEVVHIELYSDVDGRPKSLGPDTLRQCSANCLCRDALVEKANSSANCRVELAHAGSRRGNVVHSKVFTCSDRKRHENDILDFVSKLNALAMCKHETILNE